MNGKRGIVPFTICWKTRKHRYDSWLDANEVVEKSLNSVDPCRQKGSELQVYKCPFCDGFHLGNGQKHPPKKILLEDPKRKIPLRRTD